MNTNTPVPPAGDVEVLGLAWKTWQNSCLQVGRQVDSNGSTPDFIIELVDRAHITRLTAEIDRLKAELLESRHQVELLNEAGEFLDDVNQGVEDQLRAKNAALQSELTKALELLERINRVAFLPVQVASDLWEVLAAPAEDVRAVVEEPVAYAVFTDKGYIRIWSSDCEAVGLRVEAEEGRPAEPLYRHPQRPVVLPERKSEKPEDYQSLTKLRQAEEWNACIEAVEELNK